MFKHRQVQRPAIDYPTLHPDETRRHIVILDDYVLRLPSTAAQVDEIFDYHLPKFIDSHRSQGLNRKVPVVFWSHGGLVPRADGWESALQAIPWWLENGVYPIYFVWDTGLTDTLWDLIHHWTGAWATELVRGHLSEAVKYGPDLARYARDRIVDDFVRLAHGGSVWLQMKIAAEKANSETEGGARVTVDSIYRHRELEKEVTFHGVGHSAGAIFHAHFLNALVNDELADGNRPISLQTLQLLAPAISVSAFLELMQRIKSRAKSGVDLPEMTMYSMTKEAEEADQVIPGYRDGSLLYFVRNAFEEKKNEPILGLRECFDQAKNALEGFFTAEDPLIWSPTDDTVARPGSRSHAVRHGDFPRDQDTMDSVLYRILGREGQSHYPEPGTVTVPRASPRSSRMG